MAAESAALLARFQPCMRYDSLESYFADSAAEWTLNPGNRLLRADGKPVGEGAELSLELLDGDRYSDGSEVRKDDKIEAARDDYGVQYAALRQEHQELRNVIYGRAVRSHQRLWLQYWFFYFFNDYQLAWGIDLHEGDWEMIQLRMDEAESEPEIAVYAQHAFCEVRPWERVPKLAEEKSEAGLAVEDGDQDRPLVYVGRGSHASFFSAGYHPTAFYDVTDGKRAPKKEPRLEVIPEQPPGWLRWPGYWGGERAGAKGPGGPVRHDQWENPEKLLEKEAVVPADAPGPDQPRLWARRRRGHLLLEFDFSKMPRPPRRLLATVNSSDEKTAPPRSFHFGMKTVLIGSLQTRIELDPKKHYDVSLAVIDGKGRPTDAEIALFGPAGPWPRELLHRLGQAAGHLVHVLRLLFKGVD